MDRKADRLDLSPDVVPHPSRTFPTGLEYRRYLFSADLLDPVCRIGIVRILQVLLLAHFDCRMVELQKPSI
ncbi:hypothetical protein [Rhodococcus erythropolis]|uniref:hypothetical protein n=1 Tax=Rhodococcus erythropolis TaxID=1833 RepID=UPI00114CB7A4|nr:hypothetical protein [Rhodococcus erythropolis]MDF2468962.1 hypothetical protein [Rhodococcus erythropolis]